MKDNRNYPAEWSGFKSVTEIIALSGLMGDVSKYYTDWHRDRGSYGHKAIELYEAGDLDEGGLDPVLRPYLDAWLKFKRDVNWITAGGEKCFLHPVYGYKMKPDVWGMLNGSFDLIDVKLGAPAKWHYCQLSAYQDGLRAHGIKIVSSWPLYLTDKGKYKLGSRRASRDDFAEFMNAYNKTKEMVTA